MIVHEARNNLDGNGSVLHRHNFTFDMGFNESQSNEKIFNRIGKPLCERAVKMRSTSTIFAYGQTGAGKTYTVAGSAGFCVKKDQVTVPGRLFYSSMCLCERLRGFNSIYLAQRISLQKGPIF